MKKLLALLGLIAMASVLFVGCPKSDEGGSATVYYEGSYNDKFANNGEYGIQVAMDLETSIPAGTTVTITFTATCEVDVDDFAPRLITASWSPAWEGSWGTGVVKQLKAGEALDIEIEYKMVEEAVKFVVASGNKDIGEPNLKLENIKVVEKK